MPFVMYYRATENNPKFTKRFSPINIRKELNDELKTWHDRVREIRNRAIAHYGEPIEGVYAWHKDAMVIYIDNDTFHIRYPPVRTGYLAQVVDYLEKLCSTGLMVVKSNLRDKEKKFNFELHEAMMYCPELKDILHRCLFDADAYFGVAGAGQRFRDLEAGKVSGDGFIPSWSPKRDRF